MRIEPFRMERMQSTFENYVDYNLSESGVHPMSPRELLDGADAQERLLSTALGYCQSNGTEELRERVALFYDGAARDNVVVTNGGAEANFAIFWSLLEPEDRVAYMIPNYLQTLGLSHAFAGSTDVFRLRRRRGPGDARWALDPDALARAVTRKTRLILVTNPNNPTGAVLTEAEMDEVVRQARRVGAWIVADEIYRGAEVTGGTSPTFWGRYERVLVTAGLSKAFGLPGLRVGWVLGPPRTVERIWSYKDYTTIAPGVLSDHMARVALEPARREAILARSRGIIRRNLPVVDSWVRGHGDILEYTPPRAGAIAFVRYDLPIRSIALVDRLRLEQSVLIVAGDQVGMGRHIRIGFGSETEYVQRGLERVDVVLRDLRKTGRPGRLSRPAPRRASSGRPRTLPPGR
jgi:aspartate/methionine/tyrosine aminotransferase